MAYRRPKMKKAAGPLALTLVLLQPVGVMAQGFGGADFKSVGISFGYEDLTEDGDTANASQTGFVELNGAIGWSFGNGMGLSLDGVLRGDQRPTSGDFDDDEFAASQFLLGAHLTRSFTPETTGGVFLAYGKTFEDDTVAADGNYDILMSGIEGHHVISDRLSMYAQLGYGMKVSDGQDDREGFVDGPLARFGGSYGVSDRTAITFEVESAMTFPYVDGDDARMFGVTLGGETALNTGMPLTASYFVRYANTDLMIQDRTVDELAVGFGLTYDFGGAESSSSAAADLTVPRLPLRGLGWTEFID